MTQTDPLPETLDALLPELETSTATCTRTPSCRAGAPDRRAWRRRGSRPPGSTVTTGVGGTGVVGVLANGDGPTVMLRADMDALPVEEATGLPYASTATATDPDGNEVPGHARLRARHARHLAGRRHRAARRRARRLERDRAGRLPARRGDRRRARRR